MADPSFVQFATGSAQSTTVSVSAPTGTVSGNHQLIFLGVPSTSITVTSVPSGWTLERTQQNTIDSTPFTLRCYKSSTATGSASFTVSSSTTLTAVRVTYSGGTGVESSVGSADSSSGTSHALATATTTVANSMVVAAGYEDSSSSSKTHTMSGWTERADFATSGLTRVGMIAAYDIVKATAGTQGGTIVSSAADYMATISVVLAADAGTVHTKTGGAAGSGAGSGAKEIGALEPPADIYNLTTWHLTTPADSGEGDAEQIDQPALDTYASEFFYLDEADRMVCVAPVDGFTTSGASGATRTELRNRESNYALTAFDPLTTARRQLTITTRADPTSITGGTNPRQEAIIFQIHGATGTPPLYLAAEWTSGGSAVTPRIRLFLSGTGMSNSNVVTGISTSTDITIRVEVESAVVSLWIVAGQVADLPGTPTGTWAAADFTDDTDWYFKAGIYNKTEIDSGSSGQAIAKISHFELIQPGSSTTYDKTGGAAALGAGSGAKTVGSPAVHTKTGAAAALGAGSGARVVTPAATHEKAGGAAAVGAGSGARAFVQSKTGGGAAVGAGVGVRALVHVKTGGAAATGAGAGARTRELARTGGAAAIGSGAGSHTLEHQKSGGGAATGAGSGAKVIDTVTVHDKSGGAAGLGAGSGAREFVRSKTGAGAAVGAGTGTQVVIPATVYEKTGGAAALGAGSGHATIGGAIEYSKTGGAAASAAGSGASEVQHPAVHDKTGGAASTAAGAGAREYVRSYTGGAGAVGAGSGAAQIVPPAIHTRGGGAAATGAGTGALDLLTPTVHAKTGGAAARGTGTGGRTVTSAAVHVKTGGAAATGGGIALVEVIPPAVYVKAGGAVAIGAGSGRGRVGGRLHAGVPRLVGIQRAGPPVAVGRHRAGEPYAVGQHHAGPESIT